MNAATKELVEREIKEFAKALIDEVDGGLCNCSDDIADYTIAYLEDWRCDNACD